MGSAEPLYTAVLILFIFSLQEDVHRYACEDEYHSDDGLTRTGNEGVYHQPRTEYYI